MDTGRFFVVYGPQAPLFSRENFDDWPWLSLYIVRRRYVKHLRTGLPRTDDVTLDQRGQLVPYSTLVPRMVGRGGLDNLDGFDVRLVADQMGLDNVRLVVRDPTRRGVNLDVQRLGVWWRNGLLLGYLEHLVHFRMYLRKGKY